MAQYARPTSDVTVGDWATAPLYAKVDEAVADDGDFIVGSGPNLCELGLSSVVNPGVGDVTIRFRYRKAPGSSDGDLIVTLMEGVTQIAQTTVAVTSETFAAGSLVLLQAERDAIVDWSNLRIRFERPDAGTAYAGSETIYAGSESVYAGSGV